MKTRIYGPLQRRWPGGVSGFLPGVVVLGLVGLVVLSAGCGGGSKVGDAGTVPPVSTAAAGPRASSTTSTGVGGSTGSTARPSSSTSSRPTATPAPSAELRQITVYFVSSNEKVTPVHRLVPRTQGVASAAIRELLEGPTAAEKRYDGRLGTTVPAGTRLLGISVKDHVALVDLSKEYASGGGTLSMSLRLAQVVYTVTQFPTVDRVNFALDGKRISVFGGEGLILDHPVGRKDYEELTPAILVETPTLGDRIASPLRVTGTANVFEALFQVELLDAGGAVLAKSRVQASSGTGTRGTFDLTLRFSTGQSEGKLVAFALSPKDGSRIDTVTIPVRFAR